MAERQQQQQRTVRLWDGTVWAPTGAAAAVSETDVTNAARGIVCRIVMAATNAARLAGRREVTDADVHRAVQSMDQVHQRR